MSGHSEFLKQEDAKRLPLSERHLCTDSECAQGGMHYHRTALAASPMIKAMPVRCEYVQKGIQCNFNRGHDGKCIFVTGVPNDAQPATEPGLPPEPAVPRSSSARDVLREQSELISKYAAHCERKTEVCSTVATLLEYTARAKLAREIALIYFRAATLEDSP